jgi:serine/threonine-protein kinase
MDRDERLAQLLTELTEQRRQGRSIDREAVARDHPDLADELSGLWSAVELVERFGASTPTQPHLPPASENLPLPRSFGEFVLLEELGSGGMGVVYKARQLSPERLVALKLALAGKLATAEERARFAAEAKMAARLNHTGIVQVYDVGEHDGQIFFSMQFIEGTTLSRRVAEGPLPPREAARIMAIVARAVEHAHDNGVVHRDIKPSNVILDGDGQPHVTDFGLARRVEGGESLTRTGAIVGTPSYMAPEQAEGKKATPSCDVYSLGAVLYHLLTGKPPFQAASMLDTLLLVREQDLVEPRRLNPKVDRDLEWICLKALEKRPEDRYRSAGQLAEHLDAFLQGETPPVWPSNMSYFIHRMLRPTMHAPVLENWGALWMWHSLMAMFQCTLTAVLAWRNVQNRWPYMMIWGVGLLVWAGIFWALRRRAGPVLFIERQIAHVWGAAIFATITVFFVEMMLDMPVLQLSPILAILAGTVFMVKAGMLSGEFYFAAAASFLTAVPMALLMPKHADIAILTFGFITSGSFFVHGLRYHRRRKETTQEFHHESTKHENTK